MSHYKGFRNGLAIYCYHKEAIMMYKVLIAERDMKYVDQLRGIINREYRNCQITGIVGSSREVIEILGKENSDIDVAIINVKLTWFRSY